MPDAAKCSRRYFPDTEQPSREGVMLVVPAGIAHDDYHASGPLPSPVCGSGADSFAPESSHDQNGLQHPETPKNENPAP